MILFSLFALSVPFVLLASVSSVPLSAVTLGLTWKPRLWLVSEPPNAVFAWWKETSVSMGNISFYRRSTMYRSLRVRRVANPVVGHVGLEAMRKRARQRGVISPSDASVARAFYRDALGGHQVWPAGPMGARGRVWFLVAGALIEVGGAAVGRSAPVVLDVDDPDELAQRCWDAGFTVRMHQDPTGRAPVSVFDPFDRRIDLAPVQAASAHRTA